MTREELTQRFLESKSRNYVLQLPTGYGKSLTALKKLDTWYHDGFKILIVIPKLVLIDNWKDEIHKWGYDRMLKDIVFTTYVSLPKRVDKKWGAVVHDEAHHLSERCREAMQYLQTEHILMLSATLKRDMLSYAKYVLRAEIWQLGIKDAIESNVLPDPRIILIPLSLDNREVNHAILKNVKKNASIPSITTIRYADKWKYRSYKAPLRILCTQQQYYNDLSSLIDWYKQKGMSNAIMKNMWLHKAGERLKWLAKQKESVIKGLLKLLKNHRVLTFCQSIEQTESLGCPCVNSKVGLDALEKFNAKKIKHISACAMLDEGCNLVDCQIGVFQMINSSPRVLTQRIGRELRHKHPVLIFPYYINTREDEIIQEIVKDYNPSLITTIGLNRINNIKDYL